MTPTDRVHQVARIHARLRATDLAPGPEVNALFSSLVSLCLDVPDDEAAAVLDALGEDVQDLRALCGEGETLLEREWAHRICTAADPYIELASFPYVHNYRQLAMLEIGALMAAGGEAQHVVLVGSGPLPLTAIVLALRHGMTCTVVDSDPVSLAQGAAVVEALGLSRSITSVAGDATGALPDLATADLVVLAALVGSDDEAKARAIGNVATYMRPGTHLLVRTAAGMRSLLYQPVPSTVVADEELLHPVVEVHPRNEVINSVLLLERTDVDALVPA